MHKNFSLQRLLIFLALLFLSLGASQLFSIKHDELIIEQDVIAPSITLTPANLQNSETAVVKRVIDGDTIELSDGKRVRYIGIDTPEVVAPGKLVECFGELAREENKRLVEGKTIFLEKDVSEIDKYGRLLRYVYVGDQLINDYLVRQGFARASTYQPDIKYQDGFLNAEKEARENERGLWGGCEVNTTNATNTTNVKQTNSECVIKGNISTNGEKIYHVPGCGSYAKTVIDEDKGERWFCVESDAENAGWRKAKNC